jgi:hypothetical protein
MSYWVNKMKCKKCSTPINVAGGMVQTTWMGPADKDLVCLNRKCDGIGYSNFEMTESWFDEIKVHSFSTTTLKYPSHCCRRCGAWIGWLGRFMDWLFGFRG